MIQTICPGRSVDHGHMVYDAVAVALVLDALRHDGPARASRIPKARCDSTYAGGSSVEVGKPAAQEERATGIMRSADGQQVLQERLVTPAAPVTVLLNWKPR